MERNRIFVCLLLGPALLLIGCAVEQREASSPIVRAAENAGSGDLRSASPRAMQQWLGQRRAVADPIEGMCKPARQNAAASWSETTEGRLCSASHELAFFRSSPVTGDGKTFRPGLH